MQPMNNNHPLSWRNETVPVSEQFDDPFFNIDNGLAETAHVFLQGNQLHSRLKDGFEIAELGFGTGLSFLSVWALWVQLKRTTGRQGTLHFTSFEAFPLSDEDLEKSLQAFPSLSHHAKQLAAHWPLTEHDFGDITLRIEHGDARQTLPQWEGKADAWFLDGFSPAKNPELWEIGLMQQVGTHTKAQGTFATYTAAGFVRRALQEAGFTVERVQGYGRKRHMSIGIKNE